MVLSTALIHTYIDVRIPRSLFSLADGARARGARRSPCMEDQLDNWTPPWPQRAACCDCTLHAARFTPREGCTTLTACSAHRLRAARCTLESPRSGHIFLSKCAQHEARCRCALCARCAQIRSFLLSFLLSTPDAVCGVMRRAIICSSHPRRMGGDSVGC